MFCADFCKRSNKILFKLILPILLLSSGAGRAQEGIKAKAGQKVAFMGDSITDRGWNSPGGYVRLVVDGLAKSGVTVQAIPAGVSVHKSNDMLARLNRDVLYKTPHWMTLRRMARR
jgi:hypothetical protein